MQFPVPQFIDVEDKIIGPLTVKQFLVLFIGGLIDVFLFKTLGLGAVFFLLGIPIAIFTLGTAFASFNGKKIYDAFPIFLRFLSTDKKYIFEQQYEKQQAAIQQVEAAPAPAPTTAPEPVTNQLKALTLELEQKNAEELEEVEKIK